MQKKTPLLEGRYRNWLILELLNYFNPAKLIGFFAKLNGL